MFLSYWSGFCSVIIVTYCILQLIEIFAFSILLVSLIVSNGSFELTICCVNMFKEFVLQKDSSVFGFFAVFLLFFSLP